MRDARKQHDTRAAAATAPLDLDRFLPYRLAVLAHALSRDLGAVYVERFDLTIPEWRLVANLGRSGALTAGDLAERSNLDKPKVTRALKRLEQAGRVSRVVDLADRRSASIMLTPEGRKLYATVAALALDWEAELLAPFSATDRADLRRLLDRLSAHAEHRRNKVLF
jgi:DNA-binding MarR family transcriptional regulator